MKQLGIVVLSIFAAASMATSVLAADGHTNKVDRQERFLERFKKADTNGDGKLSLDEFKAAFSKGDPAKRFAKADANSDGFVTPEELQAAHRQHQAGATDKPAK